jgi:hypothetical protein
MNNDPHYGDEAHLISLDETDNPFDIDLTEQFNETNSPDQITAEYLWIRALELGQEDYPKLPYAQWAERFGDDKPHCAQYWEWVASQLTSYTAIVNCIVDRDPVRHSIRFIEALSVEHALEIALEDEIQERKAYPIQRDGGYKPEHFRVVAVFEGNIAHSYFKFN